MDDLMRRFNWFPLLAAFGFFPGNALIAADSSPGARNPSGGMPSLITDRDLPSDERAVSLDENATSRTAQREDRWDTQLLSRPAQQSHFFAGTEFTFMQIQAATGGRINLSFDDSDTVGTDLSFTDGRGLNDVGYAPRVWLGYQFGEKWGVAGRFWTLSDSTAGPPALTPGTTDLPNFSTDTMTDRMEASAIDIEAIRRFSPGKWKVDGLVGARYVGYSTEAVLRSFGVFTTGNFVNMSLSNGCSFNGTGVTYGLNGRRQLGDSRWHVFLSGRGSNIDGRSDSFGRAVGSVSVSGNAPLLGAATVTRNNAESSLQIGEFQTGLECNVALRCVPANAFFRTAFEYQYWNIKGPPTGGAGFGGTSGDLTTNSFASAGLGDLKLYGLAIGTGLTW